MVKCLFIAYIFNKMSDLTGDNPTWIHRWLKKLASWK